MTTNEGPTAVGAAAPPFDPGRHRLAEKIAEGITKARRANPKADDGWIARFLSGYLGSYVRQAERAALTSAQPTPTEGRLPEETR